jgi:hypothetical protein
VEAASAAVAVASVARPSQRARNLQRDRPATDRIVSSAVAAQTAVTGEAPATVLVSQPVESTPLAAPASPFSGTAESRPWPRAVLPQYSGNGTLAADYATAPSFYPFSPSHVPAPAVPADDQPPAPTQP